MALFDEIKKKVVDTTQSAVKATKEMAETSRLNAQISEEQRKITALHTQIGKLYYEGYSSQADAPFADLCAEINRAMAQIEKLRLEIQMTKGLKRCPNCGGELPINMRFCSSCGTAVETPSTHQGEPENSDIKRCSGCNAELEDGAVFCSSCGQRQEA